MILPQARFSSSPRRTGHHSMSGTLKVGGQGYGRLGRRWNQQGEWVGARARG